MKHSDEAPTCEGPGSIPIPGPHRVSVNGVRSVGTLGDGHLEVGGDAVLVGEDHGHGVRVLAQRTQRVQGDDVLLRLADLEGGRVRDLDLPLGGLVGVCQLDLQVALLGDLDPAVVDLSDGTLDGLDILRGHVGVSGIGIGGAAGQGGDAQAESQHCSKDGTLVRNTKHPSYTHHKARFGTMSQHLESHGPNQCPRLNVRPVRAGKLRPLARELQLRAVRTPSDDALAGPRSAASSAYHDGGQISS